ncbi:MAG: hypothetical protein KF819_19890 [Labilithrix sp.]|nr:hypothetical protein [Labilithrix sp.]
MKWVATIACEGGPLLVADVDGFAHWTGAASIPGTQKTLHYWGQFTRELPPPFAQDGGHRFEACASHEEAQAKLRALVSAVRATFSGANVAERDDGSIEIALPDRRRMWAELSPKSAYDAAWQAHQSEEAFTHPISPTQHGLFWDTEGPGVVEIAISPARDAVLMLRTWPSGDENEAEEERAVRALVEPRSDREERAADILLSSGASVFVWSPTAAAQLADVSDLRALADADPPASLRTTIFDGLGTVLRLVPGRYEATVAAHEGETWSCRWCRLTLKGGM